MPLLPHLGITCRAFFVLLALVASASASGQHLTASQPVKQANAASASKHHPAPKQGQASSPGTPNAQPDGASAAVVPALNQSQRPSNTGANEKQRSSKGEEEHTPEWWTAGFTGGMLIVAVLQGGLFFWQLVLMRKTIEVSNKAAEATERSVSSIEETSVRQLRAYLFIDHAFIDFPAPGVPRVTVAMRNGGQTPAHSVKHWIHQWAEEYPLTADLPCPPDDMVMGAYVMGSGATHEMTLQHPHPIVKRCALREIGTSSATIYVYGEVRYQDIFGHERLTKYRLMYGGPIRAEGRTLRPCPEGNEAT